MNVKTILSLKYMRSLLLSSIMIITSFSTFSQISIKLYSEDSLNKLYQKAINYSNSGKQDSGILLLKELLKLDVTKKKPLNESRLLIDIAMSFQLKDMLDSCLFYCKKSLKTSYRINNEGIRNDRIVFLCIEISSLYNTINQYDSAVLISQKGLKVTEKITDGDRNNYRGRLFYNLYTSYLRIGDSTVARGYYTKSIDNLKKSKDTNSLIGFYQVVAKDFKKKKKLRKSQLFALKSLELCEEYKNVEIAYHKDAILFVASNYVKLHLFDSANFYLNKIDEVLENDDFETKVAKLNMEAYILVVVEKYNSALEKYFELISLAEKHNVSGIKRSHFLSISNVYARMENYEKSLTYYKKHIAIKDSIQGLEKHKQLSELEVKYQTEIKEKEIERLDAKNEINELKLNQRKILLIALTIFSILIVLVSILIFRQNKIKQEHKYSFLEQKLLRTQMNPHFMSNALVSIQNFLHKNRPTDASKYLGKYGKLTRQILEASRNDYISLEEEIDILKNYLNIQQIICPKPFEYNIIVDEEIDAEEIMIPPMISQPFIENAIKHGLEAKESDDRELKIELIKGSNRLVLHIEDNGVGREMTINQKDHISYSTDITRERIAFLKAKYGKKISLKIIDLYDNNKPSGTKVTFTMPLILYV